MQEPAIKENKEKQRDYIPFLDVVLQTCLDFKKKVKAGYKSLFFHEPTENGKWYMVRGEGWGNQLSSCIYASILFKIGYLEIAESSNAAKVEKLNIASEFAVQQRMWDKTYEKNLYNKLSEFIENLESSFADTRITVRLKRECEIFLINREQVSQKTSVFALDKQEIDDYLESYYDLLTTCVIYYNNFDQHDERDSIIDVLLHIDADKDDKSDNYKLSFWSPIILNKLQKVNYGIEEFFEQIMTENVAESRVLQSVYKHVMLCKSQHMFRWYIPGENHELLHAAIAPYSESIQSTLRFQIMARNLKKYNSYEGIGELRLGEKIIYEYNKLDKSDSSQFYVAILGDLNITPLKELHNYVLSKLQRDDNESADIVFHIYTKNNLKKECEGNLIYKGTPAEVLLNRDELDELIKTNHIVFILDCIELYKTPTASEKESIDFIKQKYAFSNYDEYNSGTYKNIDICNQNALEDIYETLTCVQCFKRFGRVQKQANASLLKFCEEKQEERGNKSAIYVYVSDLQAFENIYNDEQYYIRTEKYNEKEIGIIRYSSEIAEPLPVNDEEQLLVFSLWQFIKNVAIDERDTFYKEWHSLDDGYIDLDKVFIGIDYSDWPNLLVIHYYDEKDQYDEIAVNFINEVLLPVMNNRNRDMFITYIKKAMYSFLYSSAKNVNDMLFIHLFQEKEKLLGKVIMAEINDKEKVKKNINQHFKYSSKRFYEMIMNNYDISSDCYVGQMKTYQIISKNEMLDKRLNKREIYENVIHACGNLSYERGYLAENCRKELL